MSWIILLFPFLLISALIVSSLAGRLIFRRRVAKEVKGLFSAASPGAMVVPYDWQALPEPLQRYFRLVLPEGQVRIGSARLRFVGMMRADKNKSWMKIESEEYVSCHPPGFIWHAVAKLLPLLWIEVCDCYCGGKSNMLVLLMSLKKLASSRGREMDQSSLLRWLSEATMFPTALLPGDHIAWKPIDSKSAKAVVRDGELTASAIFYFNKRGAIRKVVTADKYREVKGKPEKAIWIGYFHNYQRKNGILVPTEVGATWKLPQGNLNYARFKLVEIDYDPVLNLDNTRF
jgi:hypothetical protein